MTDDVADNSNLLPQVTLPKNWETEQPAEPSAPEGVNVFNPEGKLVSIPQHQLQDALQNQAYSLASPEETSDYLKNEKYGGLEQQGKAFLEGAAEANTFGTSTGAETASGIASPEDIRGRREVGPGHMLGELAGLVGGAFTGTSEAKALEAAGKFGSNLLGLGTGGLASKIGSAAVKGAIENSLYQSGDEVSKLFSADPNQPIDPGQAVQSAAANIGLAGLLGLGLGGGLGTVSPLWQAAGKTKVGQILGMVADKSGGIEGAGADTIQQALDRLGVPITPEVKAALSSNPILREEASILRQSDTAASGLNYQEAEKVFKQKTSDTLLNSLGKTSEDLKASADLSPSETGNQIGNTLANELDKKIAPLAEQFENLKSKFNAVELPKQEIIPDPANPYKNVVKPGVTDTIANNLATLADQQGWNSLGDSKIMSVFNKVMKNLPDQATLGDLDKFMTQIGGETADFTNPPLMRAGQQMKNIIREAHSDLVLEKLGQESGMEAVEAQKAARAQWAEAADLKDSINSRLHVKSGDSIGSFIKNLREMSSENGEKILQRLSGKNDAGALSTLASQFPETAKLLQDFHVKQLLKSSSEMGLNGETILNSNKLIKGVEKMSPELKQFVLPEGASSKIEDADLILNQLKNPAHNFSNTGRTVGKLFQHLPAGIGAIASLLLGHNPAIGFILGELGQQLGKNAPDAVRLALLKFMGSSQPIEAEGFKTMVDLIQHTMKGENLLGKGTAAVFKAGQEVLPQVLMPSQKETDKLNANLQKLQMDPSPLLDVGGKTGHYLPDHAQALGQTAASAVNYLNSIRPATTQASPLDKKMEPSKAAKTQFDRSLVLAEQPLSILPHIKNGTILPQDVVGLKTMYPSLYNRMTTKLMDQMMNHLSKEGTIPYKTRLGLSLFLGQPMDSSMTPGGIMSSQGTFQQNISPMQNKSSEVREKHSTTSLGKSVQLEATPSQSRQMSREK